MSNHEGADSRDQLAVALTFDFDAEAGLLGSYPDRSPSALSRGAYGANEGVPRILGLLQRYALPATFFVPGDTADRHPRETEAIAAAGFEIGHHGYLHESPPQLTREQEQEMLSRGFDALDRRVGRRPVGYRSPSWELSDNTFSLLEDFGFAYDASQLGADGPDWLRDHGVVTSIVEIPSAWELADTSNFAHQEQPSYRGGLAAPSKVEQVWRAEFDRMYEEPADAAFVLTMHPEVMGRHHRMQLLERMIVHIHSHPRAVFTTMAEIAERFRASAEPSEGEKDAGHSSRR